MWLGCHWQKSNRHNSPRLVSFLFPIHVSSNASLLQLNSKARCPLCGSGLVFWLGVLFVGWQGDMKIMRKNHGAWSRSLVKHCNLQATSLPLNHVRFFFFARPSSHHASFCWNSLWKYVEWLGSGLWMPAHCFENFDKLQDLKKRTQLSNRCFFWGLPRVVFMPFLRL